MLFADYAMDLIGEMQNQIHVSSPADYEKGIAGIGVGIDYLIRNKFLIMEDDICEDFDQRMIRAVMYDPWQDFSLYDGLTGHGRYWISRLRYPAPAEYALECLMRIAERIEEKLPDIPAEEQTDVYSFLHDFQGISGFNHCIEILEQYRKWDLSSTDINRCFPRLGDSETGCIVRMYQRSLYFNDVVIQDEIDIALKQIPDLDMEKAPTGTGLLTGYAGEGMMRLMALHQSNRSWMNLL
jgi:hypothetical protein